MTLGMEPQVFRINDYIAYYGAHHLSRKLQSQGYDARLTRLRSMHGFSCCTDCCLVTQLSGVRTAVILEFRPIRGNNKIILL